MSYKVCCGFLVTTTRWGWREYLLSTLVFRGILKVLLWVSSGKVPLKNETWKPENTLMHCTISLQTGTTLRKREGCGKAMVDKNGFCHKIGLFRIALLVLLVVLSWHSISPSPLSAQKVSQPPNTSKSSAATNRPLNNSNVAAPKQDVGDDANQDLKFPKNNHDPKFPKLELTEVPLQVPHSSQVPSSSAGEGDSVHSELLYRKFILEVFSGYYGAVLNLYNVSKPEGNFRGNTRESNWNNLYNIIAGVQISGNVHRFHYNLWFAMPFNLGADTTRLQNYEFSKSTLAGRSNNDISYRGDFRSKVNYLILGGLQIGASIVDRKSAKFIAGFGVEGILNQWEIHGGDDYLALLLNTNPDIRTKYPCRQKTLSLFTGQIMPFIYLQGGAFITPFFEILASVGYSPSTIWFAEENRFTEITPTQYRRYGYFGQTILGEFQARLWLNRRFTVKLGVKGRYTLKTTGNLRTYTINDSGQPVDNAVFNLTTGAAAMDHLQISAFLGVGLTFDSKLPPSRGYAMPF